MVEYDDIVSEVAHRAGQGERGCHEPHPEAPSFLVDLGGEHAMRLPRCPQGTGVVVGQHGAGHRHHEAGLHCGRVRSELLLTDYSLLAGLNRGDADRPLRRMCSRAALARFVGGARGGGLLVSSVGARAFDLHRWSSPGVRGHHALRPFSGAGAIPSASLVEVYPVFREQVGFGGRGLTANSLWHA